MSLLRQEEAEPLGPRKTAERLVAAAGRLFKLPWHAFPPTAHFRG